MYPSSLAADPKSILSGLSGEVESGGGEVETEGPSQETRETDQHYNLCPLPSGFLNLSHPKVLSCPLRLQKENVQLVFFRGSRLKLLPSRHSVLSLNSAVVCFSCQIQAGFVTL